MVGSIKWYINDNNNFNVALQDIDIIKNIYTFLLLFFIIIYHLLYITNNYNLFINNIFNYINLSLKFIIYPFKFTIKFLNDKFVLIISFFEKLKQNIILNLTENDYLKKKIIELNNENNKLNNENNKLNYYLEITSDKLDIFINNNNKQKKIINNLNYKIKDFKNKINSIHIYQESPINRQKRKAKAKANKKKKLNKN